MPLRAECSWSVRAPRPDYSRCRAARVLAERNQAVVPVGAWVECARDWPGEQNPVFISALEVDEQLKEINRAKLENLKRFQDEVKHRVSKYARMRKKQQQQRSYEAVERDDRVIKQSSASAEHLTPNKDTCIFRGSNAEFAIFSPSSRWVHAHGLGSDKEEDENIFSDQARKLSKVTKQARHRLASCQTVPKADLRTALPGGIWRVSPTRDNPVSRREAQLNITEDFACLEGQHELPAELQEWPQKLIGGKHVTFQPERQNEKNPVSQREAQINIAEDFTCLEGQHDLPAELQEQSQKLMAGKSVTLQPELQHERPCSRLYREPYLTGSCIGFSTDYKAALILRPGVDQEESKKQRGNQYLMYRRLFMDIEREQVKEHRRQQEHEKRIAKIKEEKEKLREAEEKRMLEITHQRELVAESGRIAQLKEEEKQKRAEKVKAQQNRESTRYIEALRAQMMEKIKLQNTDLPPICCCGTDFWDSHPDKCANNCVFYKNPKVYVRALQSVLSSCDAWDGQCRNTSMKKIASVHLCSAWK
ncbi:coiled-coil domain-containing protein 15 isoform X1 [Carcharodon carcharias]|uniref:coiled-coil domain-containing protein 15 isoform X1 n=1 Tax=Carcharodon carcharias TaxID=13397 RepID=UPI001B7F67FC|nr:coiled-coil domain-containing protein 15 isoform X1 [Carcharodon carcharias]